MYNVHCHNSHTCCCPSQGPFIRTTVHPSRWFISRLDLQSDQMSMCIYMHQDPRGKSSRKHRHSYCLCPGVFPFSFLFILGRIQWIDLMEKYSQTCTCQTLPVYFISYTCYCLFTYQELLKFKVTNINKNILYKAKKITNIFKYVLMYIIV